MQAKLAFEDCNIHINIMNIYYKELSNIYYKFKYFFLCLLSPLSSSPCSQNMS